MDRIVEINLVQSDWLCWLKLEPAFQCVRVEHSGEREREESTGLAQRPTHGYGGSPYSALFHPPAQEGGHDSAEKQAHLLSMTRLFTGRISPLVDGHRVCVKGRYRTRRPLGCRRSGFVPTAVLAARPVLDQRPSSPLCLAEGEETRRLK